MANTSFTKQQIKAAANAKFYCEDLDATVTVKEYLVELLSNLWAEGEGFNSKRPFGNSGWEYDLYSALVENELITGSFYEDGGLDTFDRDAANTLIFNVIESFAK